MIRRVAELVRRYPGPLWLLAAGWFINTFAYSVAMPFLTIFLTTRMRATAIEVSYVLLGMGLAGVAGPLLAGATADRCGRRRILYVVPLLRSSTFVLLAVAVHLQQGLVVLTCLLALTRFLGECYRAVADTCVADIIPPPQRADAYSLLRVGLNVGFISGPAVGAFLSRTPWSLLFAATAGIVGANALLMYLFSHETRSPSADRSRPPSSVVTCARDRPFLAHCLVAIVFFLCTSQLISTLSLDALVRVGLDSRRIGLLFTLNGLVVIVFQVPVIRAFAGVTLRRQLVEGVLLYAFGYWSLGAVDSMSGMMVCVALISFGEIVAYPAIVSVTTSLAPEDAMGRYLGFYSTMRALAFAIGPYLGMQYYALAGARPLVFWSIFGGFGLLAAAGFSLLPGGSTIRSTALGVGRARGEPRAAEGRKTPGNHIDI